MSPSSIISLTYSSNNILLLLVHVAFSYYYVSPTLHFFATRAHLCSIYLLLLPATGVPRFLSGKSRSPRRNRIFTVFAKSIGPCKYVSLPAPLLGPQSRFGGKLLKNLSGLPPERDCSSKRVNPPYISSVSPISACFFALAFPFFLPFHIFLSCTSQTSLRTSSPLGFLLSIYSSCPYFLNNYDIPPYSSSPFCCFLSFNSMNHAWLATSFLVCSLLYVGIPTLSCVYLP